MNDALYEKTLDAVKCLFFDTSVSQETALMNLENLKEEIDLLIETLEKDNFSDD